MYHSQQVSSPRSTAVLSCTRTKERVQQRVDSLEQQRRCCTKTRTYTCGCIYEIYEYVFVLFGCLNKPDIGHLSGLLSRRAPARRHQTGLPTSYQALCTKYLCMIPSLMFRNLLCEIIYLQSHGVHEFYFCTAGLRVPVRVYFVRYICIYIYILLVLFVLSASGTAFFVSESSNVYCCTFLPDEYFTENACLELAMNRRLQHTSVYFHL